VAAVLTGRRAHLDAIVAALPCPPVMVPTPRLLRVLTGAAWDAPTQVSHRLVRLYVAALFHLDATSKAGDAVLDHIRRDLQRDQARAYRAHVAPGACDGKAFVLAYLHAYERALLKHVHVASIGAAAAAAALADDAAAVAPPTYHVLAMTPAAAAAAAHWMTPAVVDDATSKAAADALAARDAVRAAAGLLP
jgi:hypothetical protein